MPKKYIVTWIEQHKKVVAAASAEDAEALVMGSEQLQEGSYSRTLESKAELVK